jgi:hypothetical protein
MQTSPEEGQEKKEKMNLSHTQAVGFTNDVGSMIVKVAVVLDSAGLKTVVLVQNLKGLQEQVETANANQESLKRQLRDATENYVNLKRQMYMTASGYLDMAIAAVGKDSKDAANFRRLRSRIRRPEADGDLVEPVKPIAEPLK